MTSDRVLLNRSRNLKYNGGQYALLCLGLVIRAARSGRGTLEVPGPDGQGRHEEQTFSVRSLRKVFFELDYTDSIFCILI